MPRPLLVLHGNFQRPNGFSLINRRLSEGLRARGFDVATAATDGASNEPSPPPGADIYFFHGVPYQFLPAPARLRVCFAHWEYRQLPRAWVEALNQHFDLVIAPSHASESIYKNSGLNIAAVVFPAAVDSGEFHPGVAAWNAPTQKAFRFVHLGGAHQRRGTDLVLAAYAAEFSNDDNVALIVKAFHYERHRAWLEDHLRAFEASHAPQVIYVHELFESVASLFAASDVGVYPLRAECFGLPVLECLASGRRVIVTANTALDEFCTPENADFVSGRIVEQGDHTYLEPDVSELRALMRAAYVRGGADEAEHARIANTVASHTWTRSLDLLASALETHWRKSARVSIENLPVRAAKEYPAEYRFLVVAPSFRDWDLGTYVTKILREQNLTTDTFAYRSGEDRYSVNVKLLAYATQTRPDVIIGLKLDLLEPQTLAALRALGIRIGFWQVDCFDEKIPAHTAELLPHVDAAFITAKGMVDKYAALSATPVHWLYEGAYLPAFPDAEIPDAQLPLYRAQVAFVGNLLHPPVTDATLAEHRFRLLARLAETLDVKIWGVQGDGRARTRWGGRAPMIEWHTYHTELVKVCRASDIVLGLNTINSVELYFSNRVFLTLASGGFLVTAYVPNLEAMFTNHQHLVWFHSDEECLELIRYYLARPHERTRIAAQGRVWTRTQYSMDKQIQKLLDGLG